MSDSLFDVIVVGGGHAGCEASMAAAKMGARTLLLTMTMDNLAAMSCNPAVGGLAKGHLVKEIDALGGIMGMAADETAIQFRLLNRKKGAAVQATRCQSDMDKYKLHVRWLLEQQENLSIRQGEVTSLLWEKKAVRGVLTGLGEEIQAKAVILTTGTFLNGLIHIGHQRFPAGRAWEFPSSHLSEHLKEKGFEIGRLKTGTTPRLDGRTIDFDSLEPQPGDPDPVKFSFWDSKVSLPQVPCYITFTNHKTHKVIQDNIMRSALYSGQIEGVGPRYCPSIEDKIVKFADKDRHQTFLEPTGLNSVEYYPNGMSTSLPPDVQSAFMRTIPGLEKVEIIRPGYAIEYDFVFPTQLKNSLECKQAQNLYLAGQINGTSGYEEAAAQGLIAGINATRNSRDQPPLILRRDQAYIGVLIDDLVSKGTNEPYRMFTSRAEYRLMLREDNADARLSPIGFEIGLLDKKKFECFTDKQKQIDELKCFIQPIRLEPTEELNQRLQNNSMEPLPNRLALKEFLKKPGASLSILQSLTQPEELRGLDQWKLGVKNFVETEIKYAGYIKRQASQINNYLKIESVNIPDAFNYSQVGGLSREVVQKLEQHRPQTLGQANKISGITPAAITILMITLQKKDKKEIS